MDQPTPFPANRIRRTWAEQRPAFGSFVFSHDAANSEIVAAAGFEFAIIDTEHTTLGAAEVEHHARACAAHGAAALVRVPPEEIASCGRLLDAGAAGVVMSHFGADPVASRRLGSIVRYAPQGDRPSCSGVRSTRYGLRPFAETVRDSNADLLAIGIVEDVEALADLDGTLARCRVDAVMPGPGDLSTALGVPGQPTHPRVREAIDEIHRAARRAGVRAGMYLNTPDEFATWRGEGLDFFVYLFDYKVLAHAYGAARAAIAAVAQR
ncbi:MAG: aldolase/citrate lyase family protein [Casimicrobiaceae bacterium]